MPGQDLVSASSPPADHTGRPQEARTGGFCWKVWAGIITHTSCRASQCLQGCLAGCPGAGHFPSLSLHFLHCEVAIITVSTSSPAGPGFQEAGFPLPCPLVGMELKAQKELSHDSCRGCHPRLEGSLRAGVGGGGFPTRRTELSKLDLKGIRAEQEASATKGGGGVEVGTSVTPGRGLACCSPNLMTL